ncbi:MAG: acetate/propionate family kinase [Steroidobacteraceae bacterium]
MNTAIDGSVNAKLDLNVLALNSGSSSLKFGLYRVGSSHTALLIGGEVESIGEKAGTFHAEDAKGGTLLRETAALPSQKEAIIRIARLLAEMKMPAPQAIGHRIVHGGPKLKEHCVIDDSVLSELNAAAAFAPLHMPAALSLIRFSQAHFPGLPQVACFDTSFHAHMPDIARVLPIPRALRAQGVQRYGFHGLSCESIVRQLPAPLPSNLLIAHLGNGASVTAVKDGKSVDTSMGLTPTGGVIMGTRSGDLDPGVLVYLARQKKLDATLLEDLVDRSSGLLGISGVSKDLRVLHKAAPSNADARLAIDMFCYSAAKQLGAMSVALGGVEMIVFTGGIGENDTEVRARICGRLSLIGVRLDAVRNRDASDPISDSVSRCLVRVFPSREDEQIARHAWTLC